MNVIPTDILGAEASPGLADDPAARLLLTGFEASPQAQLIIFPLENAVLRANEAACRFFGLTRAELLTTRVSDLYPDSFGELHVASEAAMVKGHTISRDLVAKAAEDASKSVEHEFVACGTGRGAVLILKIHDLDAMQRRAVDNEANVTIRRGLEEWRKAERIFREIEQRNQLILSAAGEGIYGVDDNGITTFVNPAAERMLGWTAEELIGRKIHDVVHSKHADGSHYPVECCPIYNAFRECVVTCVDDEVFWRKDGKPLWIEYTSTPLMQDGRSIGAVVIFRDISERKSNEDKLMKALDENAALRERLEKENAYLQEEILTHSNHHEILGTSAGTMRIIRQIDVVAPTDANVLITGESGTGKELVAVAIHKASARKNRPLIRVNCAAIPRELFESEFFGHVKGAFSGALRDRVGRFELADGGTLFLDEVGEIPIDLQSKLLRVLQEGYFERVGEEHTRGVDVRIIAATNRDLEKEVLAGRFREDLFFRLNVFPIECQPLRKRPEDIATLAQNFLSVSCRRMNISEPRMTRADMEALQRYNWPGNARELQNVMERAAILSTRGKLQLNLPGRTDTPKEARAPAKAATSVDEDRILTAQELDELERSNLERALMASQGRVSGAGGAAERLQINPQTLYSKLRKLQLKI
ncbi:Formate hydrogenlyase transcriptional activator [Candidatus Filomicrobium marinum]|uniref:Formate hydrogenlyase transcriptional activator n=1 Tax=Candidatus Filomicrobium marinum TaxID=1608628 RepID=A0A0D6JFS6_9HYPH|nr:sigma 54-interacting transcriptional regulator [Candidatus Filomicrobium marinum]CFX28274.1 Formate hydrogenlyase transcriptional activator [Candidatus Filomicrobium marinum]CPR19668.1 Formate hydrogenlyase transcriptional activator [Candidatus Filomicrobium marinum]